MLCIFDSFIPKQIKLIFNHLLFFDRFRTKKKIPVLFVLHIVHLTNYSYEMIQLYIYINPEYIYAFNLECIY